MSTAAPGASFLDEVFGEDGHLARLLPQYETRPQQIQAAQAILQTVRHGGVCLVEAGTGVGKTLAYLVPAAYAIAAGKTVVVSTFTVNLQNQLLDKDIPLLQAALPSIPIRPCTLKGRSWYLCKLELDHAQEDLFHVSEPNFDSIVRWAGQTATGDITELDFAYPRMGELVASAYTCPARSCRYFDHCFYYRARRNAHRSNLIVVNHALLLSDVVAKEENADGSGLLPQFDMLVIDEAHQLEEAALSTLSVGLGSWEIPWLAERLRRLPSLNHARSLLGGIAALHQRLFPLDPPPSYDRGLQELLGDQGLGEVRKAAEELRAAMVALQQAMLEPSAPTSELDQERIATYRQAVGRLSSTLDALFASGPGHVLWCEVSQSSSSSSRERADRPRLTYCNTPIDVGPLLAESLWPRASSVVLTSATLEAGDGFGYIRRRLGLSGPATELVVGSPFDYEWQALLYVPRHLPAPPESYDDGHCARIAEEICRLLSLTEGRAFLLFTSRRGLRSVYDLLSRRVSFPLFRQGDQPAPTLLEAFRASGNGVLLGNQTFWQGVDVRGEALSMVVIDRIPFSVPDSPLTKARSEAVESEGGNAFWDLQVPEAQLRLKQGFGRLIRTATDVGIVCVLDTRLLTRRYGAQLLRGLPPAALATEWRDVEAFWEKRVRNSAVRPFRNLPPSSE